ncbi:MAG: hypothetical protein JW888_00345 [Pirellulales bacterium]|nr:hypothetical protein [Pirellulales bacterium]
MRNSEDLPTLPTRILLIYLFTVFAWVLEIGVVLIHRFGGENLNPVAHVILIASALALTLFASLKGKNVFRQLAWTGGRMSLTGPQVVIVTIAVVCFGGTLGLLIPWLFGG